jgi:hypothetical protein
VLFDGWGDLGRVVAVGSCSYPSAGRARFDEAAAVLLEANGSLGVLTQLPAALERSDRGHPGGLGR